MRGRVVVATTVAGLLLSALAGCSSENKAVPAPSLVTDAAEAPIYDPSLEPAAAVLALVPADDTDLLVTDFDRIRLQLGFPDLTSESPAPVRARFWQDVQQKVPLLTPGLLRADDARLRSRFDFGADDVLWEAVFTGPDGPGWVVRLRDGLDQKKVTRAVDAGIGVLDGATFYPSTNVILKGGTTDPTASWRADADMTALVGQAAIGTYVSSSCLPFEKVYGDGVRSQLAAAPASDVAGLEDLGAFSVSFGASVVTARLGSRRPDVFTRARIADTLPATEPDFGLGFAEPVADPDGGRIGFRLADARDAATLVHEQALPFAVCAE